MRMQGYTYAECIKLLGSKTSRRLSKNTTIELYDGDTVYVKLHNSPIVLLHRNGNIDISDCGFRTTTTKKRINQFLSANDTGNTLYQSNGKWYLNSRVLQMTSEFSSSARIFRR